MAAEWHYVVNRQQAGPVELYQIEQMLRGGSLSGNDIVFGPGLAEWTPAARVPALAHVFGGAPMGQMGSPLDALGNANMLNYRGMDTGGSGLSPRATDLLRQTKPWARFIAIIMFIGAGFMLIGGLGFMVAMSNVSSRNGPPAALGLVYLAMGALYITPALFLNRFASGIANLLMRNRMSDLEETLSAQKSFWKFMGIMTLVVLCLYAIGIVVFIGAVSRF